MVSIARSIFKGAATSFLRGTTPVPTTETPHVSEALDDSNACILPAPNLCNEIRNRHFLTHNEIVRTYDNICFSK
jgi:hypothetical protein